MKKYLLILIFLINTAEASPLPQGEWKATFIDITPNKQNISMAYCLSHTPDVYVTYAKDMFKKGVYATNGIYVKYNTFIMTEKHGIFFEKVSGIVSGVDHQQKWKTPIYIDAFKLKPEGDLNAAWSTEVCKGKIVAKVVGHASLSQSTLAQQDNTHSFVGTYECNGTNFTDNKKYSSILTLTQTDQTYQAKWIKKGGGIYQGTGFVNDSSSTLMLGFNGKNEPTFVGVTAYKISSDANSIESQWTFIGKKEIGSEICKRIAKQ